MSLSSPRVECSDGRPLSTCSTKKLGPNGNVFQHTEDSGKPRSLHPTRQNWNEKSELICDMFCHKCGQNYGNQCRRMKHTTHLLCPKMNESIQSQDSQIVDSPRCNNIDLNCYVWLPTDPPLLDPKVEKVCELCQEEDAILEATFSLIDNQLLH